MLSSGKGWQGATDRLDHALKHWTSWLGAWEAHFHKGNRSSERDLTQPRRAQERKRENKKEIRKE